MTACVVTAHAGTDDGVPCVQRGAHGPDCPGDACDGCQPTPAAAGRLTCTRHEDAVRDGLREFGDLYAALGEPTTRNSSAGGDPGGDERPEALPPVVAARHLLQSTLVSWARTLEDDLGIPAPDERQIELDTRGAILRRQWDVDIAVDGCRSKPGHPRPTPERRAELARVAESHRRVIRQLMDERAAGVDVVRALAAHIGDHRATLLGEDPPDVDGVTCDDAPALPETPHEMRRPDVDRHLHRERGRIFAEDILDVAHRARGLAYPRRTAIRIHCSCGARVALDTDPDRYYTCPGCGEYGTLEWWRRREAPPMTDDPLPLAELPEWLLRHHRLVVTLEQLRHWAKGERPAIRPVVDAGRDELGRRTPALYDPVAVLAVARAKHQARPAVRRPA